MSNPFRNLFYLPTSKRTPEKYYRTTSYICSTVALVEGPIQAAQREGKGVGSGNEAGVTPLSHFFLPFHFETHTRKVLQNDNLHLFHRSTSRGTNTRSTRREGR